MYLSKPLASVNAFIPITGRFQHIKDCTKVRIPWISEDLKEVWYWYRGREYTLCSVSRVEDEDLFYAIDEIVVNMNNDIDIYKLLLM